MIPKIIHYCWFGKGEKSKLAEKCLESWKKYCPDYVIKEWNEDNFDVNQYPYAKYCYENQKWAFLSDFVRLVVIEKEGGLYFDTDVELLKSPDELLTYDGFYGYENESTINTGEGFGSVAGHSIVSAMKKVYLDIDPDDNNQYPLLPCPALNTQPLMKMGLAGLNKKQIIDGAIILPIEYLNPYNDQTGVLTKTPNTISIHWYSKSWISRSMRIRSMITKPFHRIFGVDCFKRLKK